MIFNVQEAGNMRIERTNCHLTDVFTVIESRWHQFGERKHHLNIKEGQPVAIATKLTPKKLWRIQNVVNSGFLFTQMIFANASTSRVRQAETHIQIT